MQGTSSWHRCAFQVLGGLFDTQHTVHHFTEMCQSSEMEESTNAGPKERMQARCNRFLKEGRKDGRNKRKNVQVSEWNERMNE